MPCVRRVSMQKLFEEEAMMYCRNVVVVDQEDLVLRFTNDDIGMNNYMTLVQSLLFCTDCRNVR